MGRQFRLADGFDHGDAQLLGAAGIEQGVAVWLAGQVVDDDAQPHLVEVEAENTRSTTGR